MSDILLSECKDGWIYRIHSRNLTFGLFREATKGFLGIRTKFGSQYLFEEYHWDTGPPFGTARALGAVEEYGSCPEGDPDCDWSKEEYDRLFNALAEHCQRLT